MSDRRTYLLATTIIGLILTALIFLVSKVELHGLILAGLLFIIFYLALCLFNTLIHAIETLL
jgi:hypothetical protein